MVCCNCLVCQLSQQILLRKYQFIGRVRWVSGVPERANLELTRFYPVKGIFCGAESVSVSGHIDFQIK